MSRSRDGKHEDVFWDVEPCSVIEIDRHFSDFSWYETSARRGDEQFPWNNFLLAIVNLRPDHETHLSHFECI
jgi:hypothetical protein